jgi:hypothetical protein
VYVHVSAANCRPKRLHELVNADVEARDQTVASHARRIRTMAGISEAGLTQYLTRVPSSLVDIDALRQVRSSFFSSVFSIPLTSSSSPVYLVHFSLMPSLSPNLLCTAPNHLTGGLRSSTLWVPRYLPRDQWCGCQNGGSDHVSTWARYRL